MSLLGPEKADSSRTFCIAPMMQYTDRHDRFLLRLITKHALLYTEMLTTAALIHGDRGRLLRFNESEHPVALQVGGSDPRQMKACARLAELSGFDEVNINVGCPSKRVRSGRFGACLMAEPDLVADCVAAMAAAVHIPVTVKTRIGIDDQDSFEQLCAFIETVASAGCRTFIVHARKAWLQGLSPKQNRELPPLKYAVVYQLKRSFPHLNIIINGGVTSLHDAEQHLKQVDGVMMGREAYANPYLLAAVDRRFFASRSPPLTREQVLQAYLEYCEQQIKSGCHLHHLSKHIVGLFQGQPGARRWRRCLSEQVHLPDANIEAIKKAAMQRISIQEGRQSQMLLSR